MKALSLLMWTTAAVLLIGAAEALFKKWKNVPLPPGECVLSFDYCKIGCSYCTRCYTNFIDCSLKPKITHEEILRRNRTDLCITALDKCKGSCIDCTPCYTMFIDCKQQMNKNGTVPLSVNKTISGANAAKDVSGQETKFKEGTENTSDGGTGKIKSAEDNGIDISMPGIPVFIVDKNRFPGLSRSDINEFYDAATEISELLNIYGVYDVAEQLDQSGLESSPVQEDLEFHQASSRARHYERGMEVPPISDFEQSDESIGHQNLDMGSARVNLAPPQVVALEINEDTVNVPLQDNYPNTAAEREVYLQDDLELIPSGWENKGYVDDSLHHETERILLVPNDDDSPMPGTDYPADDLPGTENPADDLPGTENPEDYLPGTENPADDLQGIDKPVSGAEFQGAHVRFPQEFEHHENMNIAFEDPYHLDPRLVR